MVELLSPRKKYSSHHHYMYLLFFIVPQSIGKTYDRVLVYTSYGKVDVFTCKKNSKQSYRETSYECKGIVTSLVCLLRNYLTFYPFSRIFVRWFVHSRLICIWRLDLFTFSCIHCILVHMWPSPWHNLSSYIKPVVTTFNYLPFLTLLQS